MNKSVKRCLLCALCAILLAGCTAVPQPPAATPQQDVNASNTPAASLPEESETPPQETAEPAIANRTQEVFDQSNDTGKLTARFLDVIAYDANGIRKKTGDSILVTSPDGKLMLIDAGTPTAGPIIVDMLDAMGVTYIDYFVVSHMHADHIGGAPSILANFDIGQMYMNFDTSDESGGAYYSNMMQEIAANDITYTRINEGFTFQFGESVTVNVYNPPEDYDYLAMPSGVETRNNSSLAMRLVYGESSFLFCGDLYAGAEKRLVEKYADELKSGFAKMNHHGYDASNSLAWVRAVSPLIAVGTYGVDASKNLSYQSVGALTFFTFADGALSVSTEGNGEYTLITELDRQLENLGGTMSADGRYTVKQTPGEQ